MGKNVFGLRTRGAGLQQEGIGVGGPLSPVSLRAHRPGCLPGQCATVTSFSYTFPSSELAKQKSASLKWRLVYKSKTFFFPECFGALADCYFNSFPQMFSPYLGKTRDQRTFLCFFHEKLQCLGEDKHAWGLLPLVGDSGLSLCDQLGQSLFKSRFTNNHWTRNVSP